MDPNREHRDVETGRSVRRRINDADEDEEPLFAQAQYQEDPFGDNDDDGLNDMLEKESDAYEACGLGTRERELEELGEADARSTCFGCVYVGEREQTAIPYRDVMDLIEMARAAIGCSDPVSLAKEMERRFEVLRRECNSQIMVGERPIPRWRAATILEHIRSHNQDPEIQQWVQLRDIQELKDVALQAAIMQQKSSKRKRVDDKQLAAFEKLCRLEWFVRKQDPQKCAFYSGGGHIDPKSMRQGLLATSGKPIIALWKNATNRSSTYH